MRKTLKAAVWIMLRCSISRPCLRSATITVQGLVHGLLQLLQPFIGERAGVPTDRTPSPTSKVGTEGRWTSPVVSPSLGRRVKSIASPGGGVATWIVSEVVGPTGEG